MPIKGIPFTKGLHTRVVNIILDNISPPVFPEINPIRFEKRGRDMAVIAIGVPESDTLNLVKVTFFVDSTATV